MDHSASSAEAFHKSAEKYRDKFAGLTTYDQSYREFVNLLKEDGARVLDAACGPGAVARYLLRQKPDLDVLGIDLAPRMIDLAREAVPAARFAVHDCRRIADLQSRFDGIICAFGLPYFSTDEATAFIEAAGQVLEPGGALYLSTMLGDPNASGFVRCSTGDEVYITYHPQEQVMSSLGAGGFLVAKEFLIPSPPEAATKTIDWIVIACRRAVENSPE